jgi:fluoroacetyl-CoA thioesterase
MPEQLSPGIVAEQTTRVSKEQTASHLGSGAVEVYATPAMITLMEAAALAAIDPFLPEGKISVGIELNVRHLAATPLGQKIRSRAEVIAVEGRRITFQVQAWDEHELIGEGSHVRVIVDAAKFTDRARAKSDRGAA